VIRTEKFLISKNLFAVNLDTVEPKPFEVRGETYLEGKADAVWFRRKNGTTRACLGTLRLWSHRLTEPLDLNDPRAVLSVRMDGTHGPLCLGRWDGERYWGAEHVNIVDQHLAVLIPMLKAYPSIPPGYDGWWRF
jgi:hypothetical protein